MLVHKKKKVAIIGAGFAGLASCFHLLQKGSYEVFVFDTKGVGGGASGMAAGLVHPYVGEQVRRSALATEALDATKALIAEAQKYAPSPLASFTGIERIAQSSDQLAALEKHVLEQSDVQALGDSRFFIQSGFTVFAASYLQALWRACSAAGAHFISAKITSLESLQDFDEILIAAGEGVFAIDLLSRFSLGYTRGHTLCSKLPDGMQLPCSLVGKGYVAITEDKSVVCLGSTYDRGCKEEDLYKSKAVSVIEEKVASLLHFMPLSCLSIQTGVRVSAKGHYFPLIGPITDRIWLFTGLGSRGLLYHALFASILADAISLGSEDPIPDTVRQRLSKNRATLYNEQKG